MRKLCDRCSKEQHTADDGANILIIISESPEKASFNQRAADVGKTLLIKSSVVRKSVSGINSQPDQQPAEVGATRLMKMSELRKSVSGINRSMINTLRKLVQSSSSRFRN